MQKTFALLSAARRFTGWLGALVVGLTAVSTAIAQAPPNDHLLTAQLLGGTSGSVLGTNYNATVDPGEVNHLPGSGFTDHASVWYQWTAPFGAGATVFNIPVSSNFISGATLDTVMGVYMAVGNSLVALTNNDDSGPNTFNSRCSFNATGGNVYYVAIDSWEDGGSFELDWSCVTNTGGGSVVTTSRSAGVLMFATDTGGTLLANAGYVASQMEGVSPDFASAGDSWIGGRATVTRVGGSSGRILVDYIVTNGVVSLPTYTNVNVRMSDTNADGSTNWNITLTTAEAKINEGSQAFYSGGVGISFGFLAARTNWLVTTYSTTWNGGILDLSSVSNLVMQDPRFTRTNVGVMDCPNQVNLVGPGWITQNWVTNYTTNVVITGIFPAVTNYTVVTNIHNSVFKDLITSINGIDYRATNGTLVFDDFEMSKDITIPITGVFSINRTNGLQNAYVKIQLSNPRFDPLETLQPGTNVVTDIAPPMLYPEWDQAELKILNWYGNPIIASFPCDPSVTNTTTTTGTLPIFNFERSKIRVHGDVGTAKVNVYRIQGSQGTLAIHWTTQHNYARNTDDNHVFPLEAGSEYAVPDVDFTPSSGTLTWGQDDMNPKTISIPILTNSTMRFNRDIYLQLNRVNPADQNIIGNVGTANLTILYSRDHNEPQAAGAVDREYNPDYNTNSVVNWSDGGLMYPPLNANPGANKTVYALAVQKDDMTVIGGAFTAVNGAPMKRIARMRTNGWPDLTFSIGDGANDSVTALAIDTSGKIVIGGDFTSFDGTGCPRIARLRSDGSLDSSFNSGAGANATVWAVALQSDGKIIIGGDFTTFNGTNRARIARLNSDGSLDSSFDAGLGPDNSVYAIAVQPDGAIIIAGNFQNIGSVGMSSIARLRTNGRLDTSFKIGAGGVDGPVRALLLQPDGKIVVGGSFSQINLQTRENIGRLLSNGVLDSTFDPGSGTDGTVYSLALQPDGEIFVGGMFTLYNSTRRVGIARIFADGSLDTSFMDTGYNQFAGIPNHYANPQAYNPKDAPAVSNTRNFVAAIGLDSNTNVMIGGSFARVGGGHTRTDIRNRANVARLVGGATAGPGNVSFMTDVYSVDENAGYVGIALTRTNGTLGQVTVEFMTNLFSQGPGAATAKDFGLDPKYSQPFWDTYYPGPLQNNGNLPHANYGFMKGDAYYGPNYFIYPNVGYNGAQVFLSVNDNSVVDGNRTAQLLLGPPTGVDIFFLGGENIPLAPALGRASALLQIVDDDSRPAKLLFSSTNYPVVETNGSITLTVQRTNGTTGVVNVNYATFNGSATNKVDFVGTSGVLTFADGVTSQPITIQLKDNTIAQPDRYFTVQLSNPTGLSILDATNWMTRVTIVDNDFQEGHLNFAAPTFTVSELSTTAVIRVTRSGGASKSLTVQCATFDGTAINNVNYVGVTNTLSWNSGDISDKFLTIPIIRDNAVTTNLTVNLRIFNPIIANNPADPDTAGVIGLGQTTNAVLTIVNKDFYGNLEFSSANYNVMENSGFATITVNRILGSVGTVSIGVMTSDATAVSGLNYSGVTNRITFGPGETSKTFTVPIVDDNQSNPNRTFRVLLFGPSPAGLLNASGATLLTVAKVTIIDNESVNEPAGSVDPTFRIGSGFNGFVFGLTQQPDGALLVGGDFTFIGQIPRNRIARLQPDGTIDLSFQPFMDGADGTVRAIISQNPLTNQVNGPVLIGGSFNHVNGVVRHSIARLNYDGALDQTFDPGAGVDGTIFAMLEVLTENNGIVSRQALVAGNFAHYGNTARNGIARINDDGTLDTSFDPGTAVGGTNGTVFALAAQADGQIILGGDFTQFAAVTHSHLVRIGPDGAVDSTFNPTVDGSVRSIVVQPDGKILIGGAFKTVNNTVVNNIARLNQDGTVDRTFQVGSGTDDTVLTLALDTTGKIMVGGEFLRASGVTRRHLTRLNADGTVDPGINFGDGADGFVSSVLFQDDGKMVVAGGFNKFNLIPSPGLVRLFSGDLAGSGTLEFDNPVYSVNENGTNAFVSVRRLGGTFSINGDLSVDVVESDGSSITGLRAANAGVDYLAVPKHLVFPAGETYLTVAVPVVNNFVLDGDRSFTVSLTNYSRSDAGGPQPTAAVTITDDEAGIRFASPVYRVIEDVASATAQIDIARIGNTNSIVSVNVVTTTNGTAAPTVRYVPLTNTVVFGLGQTIASVFVPIINDNIVLGDQTVTLGFTNMNGAVSLEPSTATLTIVEDDTAPGNLMFSTNMYVAGEGDGSAFVQVIRTNGITGTITVDYTTTNGTALAGTKYAPTNGTLVFADGETSKFINVGLVDNATVEGNQNFLVRIGNAKGGASIVGTNVASVVIIDNDSGFSFSQAYYTADELAGSVSLLVNRVGDSNGVLTVDYTTKDGSAFANTNYLAASNTLRFASGEQAKSITIPILHDQVVAGNLSFTVVLSNPAGRDGVQLAQPPVATVLIDDGDCGFRFSTNSYSVHQGGTVATNAVITVVRYGSVTHSNTVQFMTQDGTATAGSRYGAVSGTNIFRPGVITNTFIVPIKPRSDVVGDQTVNLLLFKPTGGAQVIEPSEAVLTIMDDNVNLSFSSPTYVASECPDEQLATITVVRSGLTNNEISVNYQTLDDTGVSPTDYQSVSGTLTFKPGQVTNTFQVRAHDNTQIVGDKTVTLLLQPPTGGASLGDPATATLVIKECDGTLVKEAGMALVTEPAATRNGTIDSNETVTVRFGLRCESGFTGNLMATLLATNGVTGIQVPTQSYGVLPEGGHAVSMPFTFTVIGTNGQSVDALFVLSNSLGTKFDPISFNFRVGQVYRSYTNTTTIQIRDNTNALPYPSAISVSDIQGTIGDVKVTLMGVTHTYPDDINVLLSGPSGANTLLMSHAGGINKINEVNLGFDDFVSTSLPDSGQIVTGTNKPTAYSPIYSFLGAAPSRPFGSTLSVFRNTVGNGTWSLWVEDDKSQDVGSIANGWVLSLASGLPVSASSELEVLLSGPSAAVVGNLVTNFVTVTNYGPADASAISLSSRIPSGMNLVSASVPYTVANGILTIALPDLLLGQGVSLSLVYMPQASLLGTNSLSLVYTTNTVSVTGSPADPYTGNNTAALPVGVTGPNSDLALQLMDAPDPISFGGTVTYTLVVTNGGPSMAQGVMVRNVFPDGIFMSQVPANLPGATLDPVAGTIVIPLGDLAPHAQQSVTLQVQMLVSGVLFDSADVWSSTTDPLKLNNHASVKSEVRGLPTVAVTHGVNGIMLSWPANSAFGVECTGSLAEPVQWQDLTNPVPALVGDQMTLPITYSKTNQFFRLKLKTP